MSIHSTRYSGRGVSADKSEVHEAIKHLDKGLYSTAFCKILPDMVGQDAQYCNIIHADTAGTKPSLAYLYWKETGDLSVWKDIAQDALVMNLDDMACVGQTTDFVLSSTIGRNKHCISGEVIKAIIEGTIEFIDNMRDHGIIIQHGGGETADVGDIVRTIDVGFTVFGRMQRKNLIVNSIEPGQVILGFSSYGHSNYEDSYNSGIGSNGLTSARHDVLDNKYSDLYPESFDPQVPRDLVYTGSKSLTDTYLIDDKEYSIGRLLLSPTRTFLPLLHQLVQQVGPQIKGVIHNTGGAHTKVLNYCSNVHIVKDNLLPIAPIFQLIQSESNTSFQEMFEVFNMGTRLEVYVEDNPEVIARMKSIAQALGIAAQQIGYVEESVGERAVTILHADNKYHYKK